jgi:AcrR family transcriptional regulator
MEELKPEARQPRIDARRNREAVIDAALDLLSERPNATMAAIAELSGVGRTTLYRHFSSREELVRALFERVVAEAKEATLSVASREAPAAEILRDLGPAIIRIGRKFQFLEGLRSLGDVVIEESMFDEADPVRLFVKAAQQRGEIRPELPVQWMLGSINALAMTAMAELRSGRLEPGEAGALLGEMLARSFAVDAGAT